MPALLSLALATLAVLFVASSQALPAAAAPSAPSAGGPANVGRPPSARSAPTFPPAAEQVQALHGMALVFGQPPEQPPEPRLLAPRFPDALPPEPQPPEPQPPEPRSPAPVPVPVPVPELPVPELPVPELPVPELPVPELPVPQSPVTGPPSAMPQSPVPVPVLQPVPPPKWGPQSAMPQSPVSGPPSAMPQSPESVPQLSELEPRFTWPLSPNPQVTEPFQAPESDYGPGHRGVDLAATPGQQVLAAGPGVVVFAGQVAGRGVVSIDHDGGLRTTYEPVTPLIAAGTQVYRGQPIANVDAGHPGCPVAACLHWGVRRGEEYLDPLGLIRTESVIRLKPWITEPA